MKQPGSQGRRLPIALWLAGVIICCIVIARTTFTADLSAFLPQTPSKEQQVLLDQLRDGVVSRLILIGIEGSDAAKRAALSKDMAKRLRGSSAFVTINNGEPVNNERDQAYLFGNRYLLSPVVTPQHFTVDGLNEAIGNTIDLLASPAGMLIKPLLPRDPTGETIELFNRMNGGNRPQMNNGVWASRDGTRAVLLAQARAAGADTDGQQQAMQEIRQAFEAAVREQGAADARLMMTGPGVFSVQSRQTIESEVTRLSIISTLIIVSLLLMVYRSFTALALGLLPVVSGALAGVVAVSLGFGLVHGITLGFGTTLIGEAVDYSIYLFVQSRQKTGAADAAGATGNWVAQFWPTIRLGVLTSIVGFSSLLLSSFPGLAQLGLYSIAGLVAAATVTRFVLPYLLPDGFRIRDVSAMGRRLSGIARRMPALRWPLIVVALAACVVLAQHHATLWNTELSSLSPVSQADQAIDAKLRADMGAPDVRYMIAISGPSREAVLQSAEQVTAQLQPLVEKGMLAGFESPSLYLPSIATQKARQASLPPAGELEQHLQQAVSGLPVRAGLFQPFLADVAAAKARAPLQRADLDRTSLALAVDSLLFQRGTRWNALLPLTAPPQSASLAVEPVRAALSAAGQPNALFVDLKAESDNLYSGYLREAIIYSLGGLAGIVALLLLALRSPRKVAHVLLPLFATVVTVVAILALSGQRLTILHLIGLLLIVAVGSNYALFFSGGDDSSAEILPQTLTSLVFANLTTVAGFGILGFSQVPVLNAIGSTVGPGAVLALVFAASFGGKRSAPGAGH
ncbi:MMPL family transporter [Noviherbaspirillum massiliense]|uniref:MMPL family transporter n=1 Tax=Noviherbaspirillum massiliense TaxID=1465823 RepID=UPI00031F2FEF|nr:MMPL family transporter [Noviherbaspirillum massiliense]